VTQNRKTTAVLSSLSIRQLACTSFECSQSC